MSLRVERLSYGYGAHVVGRDVSWSAKAGQVVHLLGANGSGKTTLLKTLLGLLTPLDGDIRIEGESTARWSRHRIARAMAYVPQAQRVGFPYSARQLVLMGRAIHLGPFSQPSQRDDAAAERAMDLLGIAAMADRLFPELSGGEQQLVLIARAFAQGSPILIMDEPVASLDLGNQAKVLRAIRGLADTGLICIMSTHNPDHAFMTADAVALLDDGHLIGFDAPDKVIRPDVLRRIYDIDVKVVFAPDVGRYLCSPTFDRKPAGGPS